MPRRTRTPSYRLHRPTGQAVVTLNDRDLYLGKHGAPASKLEYDRVIAEWLANGRRLPAQPEAPGQASPSQPDATIARTGPAAWEDELPPDQTVSELIVAYWRHAERHYSRDGIPSRELDNIRDALRHLRPLYGHTSAARFGPRALKTIRQQMIDAGLSRNTINARVGKIRRLFKWAVGEEQVPSSVFEGLRAVEGLRAGRDGVRETAPVKPVPAEHVAAVLPFVSGPVRAMIELQDLTGARPGEIMAMRGGEIDRTGEVWIYRPSRHKTQDRGHKRFIALGPRAQAILKEWFKDDPGAYLFSPVDAVAHRNAEKRRHRRSPMTPSQAARRPKANPKRAPRTRYDKRTYNTAIARACDRAGVPRWHPNQLRHSAATRIRHLYDLESAQAVLGHAKISVTQLYAEADHEKALRVMKQVG